MISKRFLVVVLVLFSAVVVLLPRLTTLNFDDSFYKYPIHTNEWHSFSIASTLSENLLEPYTPYYPYEEPERFLDGSPLYHLIIYGFQSLGFGVNSFYLLTIFQTVFLAVIFFLFLSKILDPLSGFLATIFALSLESSLRWFGVIFFSPFVLSFAFLIFCLYLLHKHEKINILFILSALAMILTYPPFIIPLGIYLAGYYFFITKKISLLITPLIFGVATLLMGWFALEGNLNLLVERFVYFDYLTGSEPINLVGYLGLPLALFGLYGFYKLMKRKDLLPFNFVFLFFFMNMLLAIWPGYVFGFHYVRSFYLGSLLFMVYSGFGFYFLFKKVVERNSKIFHGFIKIATIFLVLSIIFSHLNTQIRTGSGDLMFNNFLNKESFRILNYLDHFKDKNVSIVHSPSLGAAITPMTGIKVTALPEGLVGGLMNRYYEVNESEDCKKIENIIKEENYVILWLANQKSCDFLNELINNDTWALYEYIFDKG
ncbi:MAG: hypothetical protein WDZ80_00905 [Candidatus Paceibacterota bacterium]